MKKQISTIWQFPRVSPIKQREDFYCKEAMSHPAKMPTYLAQAIILTYAKEGDLILDPMAGVGTTVIEAVKLGRKAIGIEYEEKFVKLCRRNLELTKAKQKGMIGKGAFIRGDARKLTECLTKHIERIDSIIFSPPFANVLAGSAKDNMKKFKHGSAGKDYGDKNDPNQIGNLCLNKIDTVIFSPPYEHVVCNQAKISGLSEKKFGYMVPYSNKAKKNSDKAKINIGMQKGMDYRSEMLKVYQECHNMLKKEGFMILVVKNFRRKGEEVNLMNNTIQLCTLAGFKFFQTCIHVLNGASFWQITHTRKIPYLMLNLTEYILVFRKT